jgi:hypothetical protein
VGKNLFLLLIVSYATTVLACQNKINNAKVDLFVDTNQSELEIEVARKAACERGERLVVIPNNYKDYGKYSKKLQEAEKVLTKCLQDAKVGDYYSDEARKKCGPQQDAKNAAHNAKVEFSNQQPKLDAQVRSGLEALKKENAKIVSVAISGHDGGGHFGGDKGSFSRSEMASIMADFPELNEVTSLLLLGCYTGVTNEVKNWRSIYPKVKLIGGYDGSAPLSTRPQGHEYIMDIMMNEKKILNINKAQSVDPEIKRMLAGIEGLNAAIWVDPLCSEEGKGFYYASKLDRNFNVLDPSACEKAMQELALIAPEFDKYNSGELEPPTDTGPNGALRKIYDKVRTHQHCLKSSQDFSQNLYGINDNAAFNLLFWEGVKKNFAEFYNEDMLEAEKIINEINAEDLIKGTEESIAKIEKQIEDINKEIEEYNADPEKFKTKLNAEFLNAEKERDEYLKSEQYQNLMRRVGQDPRRELSAEERKMVDKGNDLMMKSSNLQYNLNMAKNGYFMSNKKLTLDMQKQLIAQRQNNVILLKNEPEILKTVFTPTKAALKDKSRKQILENVHKVHKLLSLDGFSPKQRGALNFISTTSDHHLRYFQNPFSWHEFTGQQPEAPPYQMKLADFTYSRPGIGYGGGYMGGAASGLGSGSGAGSIGGSFQGQGMGF